VVIKPSIGIALGCPVGFSISNLICREQCQKQRKQTAKEKKTKTKSDRFRFIGLSSHRVAKSGGRVDALTRKDNI
jgi:hypothetical protein